MTAPTQKPDRISKHRSIPFPLVLAVCALLVFAVFAYVLVRLVPAPHSRSDYLVAGTLATLAAMITVFAGLVLSRRKR